jgi:hypothetical protein
MTFIVQTATHWPAIVNILIVITFSAVVSLLSVWLIRRKWPHPTFKENNEIVGFAFTVYGVIYGVVLAFAIIVAWESFSTTEEVVMREVTTLSELWRDSEPFPPEVRDNIHKDLLAYAQSVVDDEWPAMDEFGTADPRTQKIYEHLWASTYKIQPETEIQKAFLTEFLARMNDLSGDRRLRIMHSRTEIPGPLLRTLLIGAIPMIGFTLLISNKHAWIQVAMMGSIILIVLLGLIVTLFLQYHFSGRVGIQPDVFRELIDSFHQRTSALPAL